MIINNELFKTSTHAYRAVKKHKQKRKGRKQIKLTALIIPTGRFGELCRQGRCFLVGYRFGDLNRVQWPLPMPRLRIEQLVEMQADTFDQCGIGYTIEPAVRLAVIVAGIGQHRFNRLRPLIQTLDQLAFAASRPVPPNGIQNAERGTEFQHGRGNAVLGSKIDTAEDPLAALQLAHGVAADTAAGILEGGLAALDEAVDERGIDIFR